MVKYSSIFLLKENSYINNMYLLCCISKNLHLHSMAGLHKLIMKSFEN